MGYDLRITRSVDWQANQRCQISTREWLAVIDADPDLTPDPHNGPYAVRFGGKGWLDWFEGNVFTTDPAPTDVTKMLAIAQHLLAAVQGDDGEFYDSANDWRRSPKRS